MSYFPQRVEGDPPQVADSWSESLTPAEGQWTKPYVGGYVELAYSPVISRLACIKFGMKSWEEQLGLVFMFKQPQDLTKWKSLRFGIRADKKGGDFKGNMVLFLRKGRLWIAGKSFGVTVNSGNYENKEFVLDPSQWENVYDDDWTAIEGFMIWTADYTRLGFGAFSLCVDAGPFFYQEMAHLSIVSNPTGKKFTASLTPNGGTMYTTPKSLDVSVGATVYIKLIDVEDFMKWEDGSTNPSRMVIMDTLFKTITAMYTTAQEVVITIDSNPRGKRFRANGTEYKTPQAFTGDVGTTMTITLIDVEGFKAWNDGNTSTTRTISFLARTTLTANYEAGISIAVAALAILALSLTIFIALSIK